MSATYPLRKPAQAKPRRAVAPTRPRLVVIASPKHRTVARGPFLMLVGGLMLGGLLSLLMLHTLAAQDAFQQTTLQHKLATLTDQQQQLEQQVQNDSAPAALEARARALGMVPSTITSYHRRPDGRTVAHIAPLTPVYTAPTTTTTAPTTTTTTPATTTTPTTAPTTNATNTDKPKGSQHKVPTHP